MEIRLAVVVLCLCVLGTARAAVLDWNAVNWTDRFGSSKTASQTFTNVDGTGVNMTITITAGPNTSNSELGSPGSLPEDTRATISHNYDNQEALQIDADFTNRNNDYITVTVTFSKVVYGVSYEIWDIDLGNMTGSTFQDVITLDRPNQTVTLLGSNNADGRTTVDAQIQPGSNNQIIRGIASDGDKTALGNENDDLNSGDVRIDLGGGALTSFSFRYGSGNGNPSTTFGSTNPTIQRIALGDITFSTTPEVGSALGAVLACGIALGSVRLQRSSRGAAST